MINTWRGANEVREEKLNIEMCCYLYLYFGEKIVYVFFFPPEIGIIHLLCLSLVNDQLEAQSFYFIIRLLQSSTCFEQRRAHHQEVKSY